MDIVATIRYSDPPLVVESGFKDGEEFFLLRREDAVIQFTCVDEVDSFIEAAKMAGWTEQK